MSLAALASLATFAPHAGAWGSLGHQIVAAIALRHVDPAQADAISTALRAAGIADGDFVRAASYPDEYRAGHPETGPWHYVNVPLDAVEYSEDRDCHTDHQSRRVRDTPCVVAQVLAAKTRIFDPRLPAEERGLAAAMLIHFVADIHQPLHAVNNGDRGGNAIAATWYGEPVNLHQVWDFKVIEKTWGSWAYAPSRLASVAASLDAAIADADRRALCNGSSLDWANENVPIARNVVYRYDAGTPVVLGDAYYQRALPVVERRLAEAGIRLACAIRGAAR